MSPGPAACEHFRVAAIPDTIGPYRVERLLGEGGMGAVYAALHTSIERRVAIKVLHPEFAVRPEFVRRFFNEARAVNRVDHPGLVQISDYGQLPDGTAYIVMEYLRGESLSARLKREGALRVREGLRLGFLIADALTAAHEKGIIHRDLKPDNVMIVADPNVDGGERTKLLDFGIAKLIEGGEAVKTKTDAMMGTPLYMSPEQCRGAGGVDARSDVYALGVMLFDMFAGGPPFVGAGFGEIIAQHLFQEPPNLSKLAPDVPAPVAALVMRLLAKDKAQRSAMRDVAAELLALSKKVADKPRLAEVKVQRARSGAGEGSTVPAAASAQVMHMQARAGHGTRLVAAVGLLFVCAAGLGMWWTARPAPQSGSLGSALPERAPASSARAANERLPWSIDSEPIGASVFRVEDNALLCQTPCRWQEVARKELVRLRLQRAGYADRIIVVDAARPVQRHEILDATVQSAASSDKSAPDSPRTATTGSSKSGRSSRTTVSVPSSVGGASSATGSNSGVVVPKSPEHEHARPKIED